MARSRNIKPGFFANEVLGAMPPLARLLFAGLWTLCDREGRVEDRPLRIRAEVLPYDQCDADDMLRMLSDGGFIARYEADGVRVIQVLAWSRHQNPHVKEGPSRLPCRCEHHASTVQAPDSPRASTVQAPDKHGTGTEQTLLIPDSGFLIPDSGSLGPFDHSQPTTTVVGTAEKSAAPSKRGSRLPDDWTLPADWLAWSLAVFPAWTEQHARGQGDRFKDYWISLPGKAGSKVRWEATWRNWCRSAIAQPGRVNGNGTALEPDWRREEREMMEAYAGTSAARPTKPPKEIVDVHAKIVG
jgi:hypothetical protein